MTSGPVRTRQFQRNTELERVLGLLNARIQPPAQVPDAPQGPIVLIVGPPRSGSTLCLQWLASSGAFSYPSNLMARFWSAPAVGALVQRMLFDPALDFRAEFSDIQPAAPHGGFVSDLGKSTGTLAPSEFWHFWRRFVPMADREGVRPDPGRAVDLAGLVPELRDLVGMAGGRPFVAKGHLLMWHAEAIAKAMPEVIFLRLRRPLAAVAGSLLKARMAFYGDQAQWYSFKPPAYDRLCHLEPAEQVAAQVLAIEQRMDDLGQALPADQWLEVDLDDLTGATARTWAALGARLARQNVQLGDACPAMAVQDGGGPAPAGPDWDAIIARARAALEDTP